MTPPPIAASPLTRQYRAMDSAGWWLADAEQLHAADPRRFFIPPPEDRHGLTAGRHAKLLFACRPRRVDGRLHDAERLWVQVVSQRPGGYVGQVDNDPVVVTELAIGDEIEFGPEHVIALHYTVDQLGYDAAEWAHLDARILRADLAPDVLVHAAPPGLEAGAWFLSLGADPPDERTVTTLGELTDRWPELAEVFAHGDGHWRRRTDGTGYDRPEPP